MDDREYFAIVGYLSACPVKITKLSGIVHKGPNFFFQSATDFIKVWPNFRDFLKWPPNRNKCIMRKRFVYTGISIR